MKIAMLSFRLPHPRIKRGGVERVAHDLANGLARRGHEVTVWSADPPSPGALYSVKVIPGHFLIDNWLGFRLVSGYFGNLLALLPDYGDAQAIIAHGDSILLPLKKIPVIRVMHGSALDEARTARSLFRKVLQYGVYLQEAITARTQTTIAISNNTQNRYPAIREVISNGVDTSRFHPGIAEKSTDPSILFVGTLGGRKRGQFLLDCFVNRIRPALPNATLFMVSETGPPLEGVSYYPAASDVLLAKLYRRAWVFASPSCYEGFGLPYLEAMASGAAVVAAANPGSNEVLDHGRYGRICQTDDEFAPAILRLLQNHSECGRYIEKGLHRARDLSIERTIDRYEILLHEKVPLSKPVEAALALAECRRARGHSA